jgi:hypothetical protein
MLKDDWQVPADEAPSFLLSNAYAFLGQRFEYLELAMGGVL